MMAPYSFLSLFLSFIPLTILSQNLPFPKVKLAFPDVGDKDFQNETVAVMTNSNPVFEMTCTAPYPIEWIFHYTKEDDGTTENTKLVTTRRHVMEFTDENTYRFSSRVRLGFRGKILSLANYTCQQISTQNSLQTHVISYEQNDKSLIILKITQATQNFKQHSGSDQNSNCERAMAAFVVLPDDVVPCWDCQGSGKLLEIDVITCLTPEECQNTYRRQNKGKHCLGNAVNSSETCLREDPDFNPKFMICKNYGTALAQFYFFGVFKGDDVYDENIPGPPIYFSWDDVIPEDMIYQHRMHRDVVYLNEDVEFTCEYSRYYFSLGSWFGIWNEYTGFEYVEAFDKKSCDFDAEKVEQSRGNCTAEELRWKGTFRAHLNRSFQMEGNYRIFCFGPVWNTTTWINTSLPFTVEKGQSPVVTSLEPETPEEFVVGQTHRKLVCKYRGSPTPAVTWIGPNNETQFNIQQVDDHISVLVFYEVGYKTTGKYTCVVSSYLGSHEKSFDVQSYSGNKLNTWAIIGISLLALVVVVFVFLVIFRMRVVIKEQRETLRLLTDSEIQEFVQGNPALIQKNGFFDTPAVIDALPYDEKFEIAVDKLNIEYGNILGSGQYGTVVKGTISQCNAGHYVNITSAPSPTTIDIAVKISKGNLEVQNFKALLTEIKVMAYLGQQSNIVNLIGASTENIKNREIYIAVEFCEHGSLDGFLRKNKELFNGNILSDNNLYSVQSLYKWVEEIAGGLQYIHDKKIIHADLAIRNILLTSDYTAKIGDFGLSRQLVESTSYTKTTKCPLPWRNMAIESLRNLIFSVKSDIWSMGVTLWEMFTLGDIPYPGMNYTVEFVNLLEQGLRLYKPPLASNPLYDYMLMCWSMEPSDRPLAADVISVCRRATESSKQNIS